MKNATAAERPQTDEKVLIHFPNGIYGFENVKEFILLQEDENKVIWSLQAANDPYPTIIVVDPSLVMPGYAPSLTDVERETLGNPEPDDLCWLAVAVIHKKLEDSVVSLKSPIAINVKTRLGMQIILEDDYPARYQLFTQSGGR